MSLTSCAATNAFVFKTGGGGVLVPAPSQFNAGVSWAAYNNTDRVNSDTYIRIADNIKVRVVMGGCNG